MTAKIKKNQQPLMGKVISNKMDKTVVVLIEDKVKHPEFKKYISRRRRMMAHDENNSCALDDVVLISQAKPYSRHKAWKVEKIVK